MTLHERLNAVTTNLELTTREEDDLRGSVASLRGSVDDLRGTVDGLSFATANLLKVCDRHERRLTRLEGSPG